MVYASLNGEFSYRDCDKIRLNAVMPLVGARPRSWRLVLLWQSCHRLGINVFVRFVMRHFLSMLMVIKTWGFHPSSLTILDVRTTLIFETEFWL